MIFQVVLFQDSVHFENIYLKKKRWGPAFVAHLKYSEFAGHGQPKLDLEGHDFDNILKFVMLHHVWQPHKHRNPSDYQLLIHNIQVFK